MRVVPMIPHVNHTELNVDVIVTEQGLTDLRGLDPRERAHEIVGNCAHSAFRDELRAYVNRLDGGHMPHDLDTGPSWNCG